MFRAIVALKLAINKRQLTQHISTSILKRVSFLLCMLLGLILVNTLGMLFFEKMAFGDALWLSFTTVTTVGYGDFSPTTFGGRLITIISMYAFSISLLSMLVAEIIEGRMIKTERKRRGLWEWKGMQNHIQIINTPNEDTERYLNRLFTQIKLTPVLENLQIQLLTRKYSEGLPPSLSDHKILHRTGTAEEGEILPSLNLEHASHIVILARDANSSLSDSVTFDILTRVTALNPKVNIVVEAVLDSNRERFLKNGAGAVLRPIRAYPEMIVRAMAQPGTEQVLENMFHTKGDSLHRISYDFSGKTWIDIVLGCFENDLGTVLGYVQNGEIHINPKRSSTCSGEALIILTNENAKISTEDIAAIMP